MTGRANGEAGGRKPANDDPPSCDDEIRSVIGFASAICYLAHEAERAGWTETLAYLEEAYSVFLDEVGLDDIGAERTYLRVYTNPERR